MARHKRTQLPRLYLDTTIPSAYLYQGSDVILTARNLVTRDWWDAERKWFSVWASVLVEAELSAGFFPRQEKCLKLIRRLPHLQLNGEVRRLATELVERNVVPETKEFDALHLALAAFHKIDYVLSWNYAHLANPATQERLAVICAAKSLQTPILVSPESIPQSRFGQDVRRRKT
jgi:hypothetical protein